MSIAKLGNQYSFGAGGRKHTEEEKKKLSIMNLGKQYALGYKWTEKQRKNLSETVKRQFRNGEKEVTFSYNWCLTNSGVKVRSPWEKEICDLLTKFNIEYEYEKQRFILDHTTYLPDLYLCCYGVLLPVEVGEDMQEFCARTHQESRRSWRL